MEALEVLAQTYSSGSAGAGMNHAASCERIKPWEVTGTWASAFAAETAGSAATENGAPARRGTAAAAATPAQRRATRIVSEPVW